MNPTREDWNTHIRPGLGKPSNIIFESDLIEFGAKAVDRIEELKDRLDAVELKNTMLNFELKIAMSMFPEKMKMVKDTLISVDELADIKSQIKK